MAKVFTMPVRPEVRRTKRKGPSDGRFIEGQRLLADAIKYLTQSDRNGNRPAVELLSEHFRTQFRMSDLPLSEPDGEPT